MKANNPELFGFVQGYTRAYFEYVLTNDQITDHDYIAVKYLQLLEQFTESKVEDKFMVMFFLTALEEDIITGRHLDKLGIALRELASITDDKYIISNIDWTMKHLDMVYAKFKQLRSGTE